MIYGKFKADVDKILRKLCEGKNLEITETKCCLNHIHMFMRTPLKYSMSELISYLKDKNSLIIFNSHANLKYEYSSRHFWYRGYYVGTVGKNTKRIVKHIRS